MTGGRLVVVNAIATGHPSRIARVSDDVNMQRELDVSTWL